MSFIMPLIREAVIDGFLVASAKRKAADLKLAAMFYAGAAFLIIPAICFLAFAGYLALAEQMPSPADAALAVAGGLFLLAIICVLIAKGVLNRRSRTMATMDQKFKNVAESAMLLLDRQVKRPIRGNPKKSLLAAGLLGLLTARRYH